ncbi:hypothetical protein IWQ62_000477 [Dispira parvispora]|uniref:Extracellular metalloproteinase n=1 Tax=Dispira parvispora TaxID=1520584 RepID=A0A9W8AYA3_9FUNG|nr:hypothetical protein IWQ62_000477 [Dispira parvispora]
MYKLTVFTLALLALSAESTAFRPDPSVGAERFRAPRIPHNVYLTGKVALKQALPLDFTPVDKAIALAKEKYNVNEKGVSVTNVYTSRDTGITHVYLRQRINGEEVNNANMNVNINKIGDIISYGSSFLDGGSTVGNKPQLREQSPEVKPVKAISAVLEHLGLPGVGDTDLQTATITPKGSGSPVTVVYDVPGSIQKQTKVTKEFIVNDQGTPEAAWGVTLRTADDWVNSHVSRSTGKVISMVSWKSYATYKVYGQGSYNPEIGSRIVVVDPYDTEASPKGWHSDGDTLVTQETRGNNVYAQEDHDGNSSWERKKRPNGGEGLNFDFPIDFTKEPSTYTDAAVTNLFYWNNYIHDIYYRYGFTEEAGNFQLKNFGKGGQGGDPVLAFAQSGDGIDNASFYTPPDGQMPMMTMYLFSAMSPQRDGDLDSDVMIHEYTHGLSIRLTGGPANSDCLHGGEAGGMGEGWGDLMAVVFRITQNDTRDNDFTLAPYLVNDPKGIRRRPYSTNMTRNPYVYSTLNGREFGEVHVVGEIWATMLYEVVWNLIDEAGFEPELANSNSTKGNILALRYIITAMKLQPCNPDFLSARDAIIQAENEITGGQYMCTLWNAFAKRGLGTEASKVNGVRSDSNSVPSECTQ